MNYLDFSPVDSLDEDEKKTVVKIEVATLFLSKFNDCFNSLNDTERMEKIEEVFKFKPNDQDKLLYLMLGALHNNLDVFIKNQKFKEELITNYHDSELNDYEKGTNTTIKPYIIKEVNPHSRNPNLKHEPKQPSTSEEISAMLESHSDKSLDKPSDKSSDKVTTSNNCSIS
jgi:hypothetical protein